MILLIDNYDSFTYNLYQYLGEIDAVRVEKNDRITVADVASLRPDGIVLSPGPGRPADAGVTEAIAALDGVAILGVCLGHQAICEAYGGAIGYARTLMHGKSDFVTLEACPLFEGIPAGIRAGRYHSLAADEQSLPAALEVTARADDGEIMGVRVKDRDVYGLQFHPESILTEFGKRMIENFVRIARRRND